MTIAGADLKTKLAIERGLGFQIPGGDDEMVDGAIHGRFQRTG
jgi:hypothetical protein